MMEFVAPSSPSETLTFLGPATSSARTPPNNEESVSHPPSGPPTPEAGVGSPAPPPSTAPPASHALPPWPSLSLHLAPPSQSRPQSNGAAASIDYLATLQAGRAPPPGASLRTVPSPQSLSIRLSEPKPEPVLFSPTSLPSAHAQRFLTSAGSEAALRKAQPLAERSSLEKSLAAGLDVRDMIDALVVERLREFTNLGTSAAPATWPAGGGASSSHEGGHGPGGSPTSDQEGGSLRPSHREWLTRLAAGRDTEGPPKKEPSRSRESDAEEGRKKRSRSRSRSSSPHEGQGGHERVGGNREAVRKYREKKKVEFASMQNQLAQLHKLCAAQDDQLRHKARLEEELVALWRQIAGLQEKVSRGHNLLVSELFAIKPPRSLT